MSRFRSFSAVVGLLAVGLILVPALVLILLPPGPALAQQQPTAACAATGYLIGPDEDVFDAEAKLYEQPVHSVDGVPLDRMATWVVPDGMRPVVVLDSNRSLGGSKETHTRAGMTSTTYTSDGGSGGRYVATNRALGSDLRMVGWTVASGRCEVSVILVADRPVWSTFSGALGVAVAVVFGSLMVLVARLRTGSWLRRFLSAAPLGPVAGLGQALVLYEAGVLGPYAPFPWWLPAAGVGLAALLPLTRWRRRRRALAGAAAAGTGSTGIGAAPTVGTAAAGSPAGSPAGVGAMVNAGVAVVAGVAVAVSAVLVATTPAAAQQPVITPEQARVIFARTVDDGLERSYDYIAPAGSARANFEDLAGSGDAVHEAGLTGAEVDVPPGQDTYPAYFVGSARLQHDHGVVPISARFDRESRDEPWLMTTFSWTADG